MPGAAFSSDRTLIRQGQRADCAISLLPFIRKPVALPDRRRPADLYPTRQRNLEKIQNRTDGRFVIATKLLVLDAERLDADAGKESTPNAFFFRGLFEALRNQEPIELRSSRRCFAFLHFPETGLHRACFGNRLAQFFPARDLNETQTGKRRSQQLQIRCLRPRQTRRFGAAVPENRSDTTPST